MLCEDPVFSAWLASLENPVKTREGFGIYTMPNDLPSDWIKIHGQYELPVANFILEHLKENSTFLDVGSNIGYLSLLAAHTGKAKVIAFEPQRNVAEMLVKSAAYNHFQNRLAVECVALSNVTASMELIPCPGNSGHAHLAEGKNSGNESELVPVLPLDDWLGKNPPGPVSVCKIDTEGAEYNVLLGMAGLLDRDGPALVVEIIEPHLATFGASSSGVFDFLKAHGYRDVSELYTFDGDKNRYFVKNRQQ